MLKQRETMANQRILESQAKKEGSELLSLKVNGQVFNYPQQSAMLPDPERVMASQNIYPASYVPIPNPFKPTAYNMMIPWQYVPNNVPVIKKYNITLSNANGDYTKISQLFEDVLPSVNGVIQKNLSSIGERLIIHNYIRSIFIRRHDGEEINMNSDKNSRHELNNLLSHVKLLDMNPYHFSRIESNPYKTLPENFAMFRSCYPIKHERRFNNVVCAYDSLGINIRVYRMRVIDIIADELDSQLRRIDCDLWREIFYYEYVREEIIKKKISPNFIMMYSYYMSKNTGINFNKLINLKSDYPLLNNQNMNNINKMLKDKYNQIRASLLPHEIVRNFNNLEIDDIIKPSDKCIVALTESPTHNIINFATKTYEINAGPIRKMVSSGYYDDSIWLSLLFQLVYSLFIMYNHKITIINMDLARNIYIKDLYKDESNTGYWKYRYNNIEFYVPNNGYILLIDTAYTDIDGGLSKFKFDDEYELKYNFKIEGKIYNNRIKDVLRKQKENIVNLLDKNEFNNAFTQYGGLAPPKKILDILDEIHKEIISEKNISNKFSSILVSNFKEYLHNRIGELIREGEKENLNTGDSNFKPGSLIAHKISGSEPENYTFALYLEKINDSTDNLTDDSSDDSISERKDREVIDRHRIFTIDHSKLNSGSKPILIEKEIRSGDIIKIIGTIDQNFKPNQKLSEDDIIETYTYYDKF